MVLVDALHRPRRDVGPLCDSPPGRPVVAEPNRLPSAFVAVAGDEVLLVLGELESKTERHTISGRIAARQGNEAYHHGPTPLGSEEADDRLVEVLDRVARGELSRRQAATEAATSRRTVQRSAEDRAELHGP